MNASRIKLLQSMPVFGAVNEQTLQFILEGSSELQVAQGEPFFEEGDPAESFYVLQSGRVEVTRRHDGEDFHLAELGPGDTFGEMAIIECRNRNASAVAMEDCSALRVPLDVLHAVSQRDLEQFVLIQMNLGREVSRRLRDAAQQLFEAKVAAHELGGDYWWYLA